MKKVIQGKLYDTETATEVHEWSEGALSDFQYVEETLYRKRTGEYFVYGYGGPMSQYAEPCGSNSWQSGSRIMPMTYDEARAWAEEHMDADDYQIEFGPAPEGDGEVSHIHVTVSEAARRALDTEVARTGETQSAVVNRLLLGLMP